MNDVYVGKGTLAGKGVYTNRDFKKGDIVIQYRLTELSNDDYEGLSDGEKMFTHEHCGTIYLYGEPERYVNHSDTPNTLPDLMNQCDVAVRNIRKGEMITTDEAKDDAF